MYYMSVSPDISSLDGAAIVADARVGGNGDPYGTPEFDVGNDYSGYLGGHRAWDQNTDDGFCGSSALVSLSTNAFGSTFSVGNPSNGSLGFDDDVVSSIGQVAVRVAAQAANMRSAFSDVCVKFYRNGQLRETVSLGSFEVETTETDPTGEKVYWITPPDADDDAAVLTGSVQFACTDENYLPADNDAFAQFLVFAS